jgi:ADP-ribosylglycohydrolase
MRRLLRAVVDDRAQQGHAVDGLAGELEALPDSYDALAAFADRLRDLPLRADWPYVEPDDIDGIRAEWDAPSDATGNVDDAGPRIEAAFFGRVAGCMLGKPFEIDATFEDIRAALEPNGEWPLSDYPTERSVRSLPRLQRQWAELVRERIDHVAPDDDINYTIIAMLLLEQHGVDFTHDDLRRLWLTNLPVAATFGPERTTLLHMGIDSLADEAFDFAGVLNPGDEYCGALIRADAYGYACPGRPALAAELAHRDASLTHRRTGIYGAMFVAAAIATAFVAGDSLEIFRTAARFVPRRSRFAEAVDESLRDVTAAKDWIDGFERVRMRYGEFGFCRIYQEIGTVMNSVRFAADVGDGICKQVMQGNDTDSFGATAGSIFGAFFGPGHLEAKWTEPFRDTVHTALAMFHEQSLARIAGRMAQLPQRIAAR